MIGYLLSWALQIFLWLLFARFIIDLVRSVNRGWRPRGIVLVLLELVMTITDVPLKFLRRFIKPVRVGALALDLAWTVLVFAVILLRNYAQFLPF